MKRLIYLVILLLAAVSVVSCSSKMVVVHIPASSRDAKLPADGIFFALPRTVITVDIPVELTESKPGKFADLAPVFLPDKKAVKTKGKKLKLKMAKFNTYGEPDPKAVYYVKVVGGAAVDWSRTFQFNEDGTIASAKQQADNQVSDILIGTLSAAMGLAAKAIGAGVQPCPASADTGEEAVACYLGNVGDEYKTNFLSLKKDNIEVFNRIVNDNTEKRNGKYSIKSPSLLTEAVDSVRNIKILREKPEELFTNPRPGGSLTDSMFTRINSLIIDRIKDFIGTETTSAWTGSFEVRPQKITDVKPLFKMNPTEGLCVVADIGGKDEPPVNFRFNFATREKPDLPLYCKDGGSGLLDVSLKFSSAQSDPDQMLTRIKNNYIVVEDEDVQPLSDEKSFRYRIPASTKVSVVTNAEDSVRSETRMLVGQFGVIIALPAAPGGKSAMYSLQYYTPTGALKNFDLTTKAILTKGMVDTLSSSAGGILDAEKKAAEAKAKAADQLNQIERKRTILEDEVKIQKACQELNIDCSKP